ncbi:MAG TPA: hypothetical protein VFE03_09800, partial [Caulobacteraceae bacterium]|nr:hypothetical protein [Caulobacteraceae bacterium]
SGGAGAMGKILQLLGINSGTTLPSTDYTGAGAGGNAAIWQDYLNRNPDVMADYQSHAQQYQAAGASPLEFAARHYAEHGQAEGRQLNGAPTTGAAASALETIRNYPGYQFRFNEGLRAVDQGASARGTLGSVGAQRDEIAFGQGLAETSWDDYLSRLFGVAQLGENAGAQTGAQGVATGQNVGASMLAAGQAQASGTVGSANAITGGINNGLAMYSLFKGTGGGSPLDLIANSGGADVGSLY